MPNDLTFTLTPNFTAVPLQDGTLSVTPSANFITSSYLYQWKVGGSNIPGATTFSYGFDAPSTLGFYSYSCSVSALSSNGTLIYTENTADIVIRVVADTTMFSRHAPRGANPLNETGRERFVRLRGMGYV